MNISDAAKTCRLSVDTIRFYERSGMLPKVLRGKRGWREFTPDVIDWLLTLERLRSTGMPLADVKRFAILVHRNVTTDSKARQERVEILERHEKRLRERRESLEACERYLAFKLGVYRKELEQ
jgi:MerR family transcriptional regulator, aldehyde-responsive regulator